MHVPYNDVYVMMGVNRNEVSLPGYRVRMNAGIDVGIGVDARTERE